MASLYKHLTLFLCFCSFLQHLGAQTLQTEWITSIPGSQLEQHNSMAQAPFGDLYTVGFFQEYFGQLTSVDSEDGFITKYNEQGQLLWIKQLAGTNTDRINGIVVANDNEIYIVGEFRDTIFYNNDSLISQNQVDLFVAKLDSSGQIIWAISAGGAGYASASDIAVMPNGNLAITGYFDDDLNWGYSSFTTTGLRDIFIAVISPQGALQWIKKLGGPAIDDGRSVAVDNNNRIYVTGLFRDALFVNGDTLIGQGSYDAYLAQYSSTGQLSWVKTMGGTNSDEGTYVNVDLAQNPVVVGWYDRSMQADSLFISGSKEEDGFALKYTPNGDLVWGLTLAGTFDERAYGVDFDENNDLYIMGTLDSILIINGDTLTNRHLNRPTDIFIAKYDSDGQYKWAQTLGHYYNDYCYDFIVKDATTLYLAGLFQDTSIFVNDTLISQYGFDVFLGKFSMDTTVSVFTIPNFISNVQVFPNPSQGQSTLEYSLHKTSTVNISLTNLLGRTIYSQTINQQPAGNHQHVLTRIHQATGLHFITIRTPYYKKSIPILFE